MRRIFFGFFALLALGLLAPGGPAHAQTPGQGPPPKVQASLTAEHGAVQPSATETVALHQVIPKGWHTYWRNSGDAGGPTEIEWQLPPGWKAGEIQWPYPERFPLGPLMTFGFTGEATLLLDITAPADARPGDVTLPAKVKWYVCSDSLCVPDEADLALNLRVGGTPAATNPTLFAKAREKLPRPAPWPAVYQAEGPRFSLKVQAPELATARPREVAFFPNDDGRVKPSTPQTVRTAADGLIIDSAPGWQFTEGEKPAIGKPVSGVLVLTGADGRTDAFALTATPGEVPAGPALPAAAAGVGLIEALLLAFAGGLILNLMPCVLPVLSMKALALAGHGGAPAAARREALSYGAGVVFSFVALAALLLALRAGGSAVGWGFQLQQPVFVAGLALLMFAVGLNLAGLYEIGAGRLAGAGTSLAGQGGATGSFFTGILAVVVATPCTAPFMAAALGFAATQPPAVALAIFTALALGFAAPFVALGFSPALLRHLPRPGTWMIIFKQVLAFPMFGAAIWLIWVLSQQTGPDGLFAVLGAGLALAFALWAYGAATRARGRGQVVGFTAAALALAGAILLTAGVARSTAPALAAASEGALAYEPYSAARLAALRAENKPVFVNATAAWCITCLVNDRVALSSDTLKRAFARAGVVALKADWTNQNPEITALLTEYGRSGVPLYLYFPPKGGAAKVLPQLLTQDMVTSALQAGT
jgi:thiol:disulfide interchange protein/DsbC/DsbD-like thiol-disulfide interchange protein